MAEPEDRQSTEGLNRLVAFADAVVAIALTLLVLPLVDIANDLREDSSVGDVLSDRSVELVSFFVSFAVIWILWRQHHQTMEYFRAYDRTLVNLHFLWLLTIVALPFATALVDGAHVEQANILYIGVLAVSVGSLIAIASWGRRHRELLTDDDATDRWAASASGLGTLVVLALALAVAIVFPRSGNLPLVLLVLTDPIERMIARRRGRRG
ncbi:TMEM175 family protein [Gordonia sp. NPDC058843]|uniref:TMEM175 family protein n=1 Tax=Gordonia sp. NPDC058843 TaxID=3346648 RepID=UPI003698D1CE